MICHLMSSYMPAGHVVHVSINLEHFVMSSARRSILAACWGQCAMQQALALLRGSDQSISQLSAAS